MLEPDTFPSEEIPGDLPEVSLITSWSVAACQERDLSSYDVPPAMHRALQEGISLLDLYFLDGQEVAWYASVLDKEEYARLSPSEFAKVLDCDQIQEIALQLQKGITRSYRGRLVGLRPRIAAIATHFPHLSLPENNDRRETAIQAVRHTLELAYFLGCPVVEAVGGTCIPLQTDWMRQPPTSREEMSNAARYRQWRMETLAQSLCTIYDRNSFPDDLWKDIPEERIPRLAMELEPGVSLLLSDLSHFDDLLEAVDQERTKQTAGAELAWKKLALNVDIAHAFLIGYEPSHLDKYTRNGTHAAPEGYSRIGHMHLSDHAGDKRSGGSHASDLAPGVFHPFERYEPWLQFAVKQFRKDAVPIRKGNKLAQRTTQFSGVIAIEMEACNREDEMLAAVHTAKRWLIRANHSLPRMARKQHGKQVEGALMVVDLGHSTENLSTGLLTFLSEICGCVLDNNGSVMSFTGDGFIALFEENMCASGRNASELAIAASDSLCEKAQKFFNTQSFKEDDALSLRIALHWGIAEVPTSGQLRGEIFGMDVVCAARVCDWLSKNKEIGIPPAKRFAIWGATEVFLENRRQEDRQAQNEIPPPSQWERYGKVRLKGTGQFHELFCRIIER